MYNVLIADDDVDAWFGLNALLRSYDIKAAFVTNLGTAKQYIDRQRPLLLFLDKHLQDKAGMDFIHYVRSRYPLSKIIMISTHKEKKSDPKSKPDITIGKPLLAATIERIIVKFLFPQSQEMHTA